ncbi:MAG: signal peptidase II [Acidobacteria bacterium RIFCSPLOWO2_12_FULL_59_11]|nr:MAG: signal peptidase II [Acidobacteria bacterium RIFCSPLOWO2_12_FULL_59_11]
MRSAYLLAASAVLVLDQITKAVILARFSKETMIPVIPGLFRLVRVENRGMAFGLLADSSSGFLFGLLVVLSVAALCLVSFLLWRNPLSPAYSAAGLALILGGAAGNLVDRIARGKVVDFLDFYIGSYHWPAFNVADSAIVIGAGILLLELLGIRRPSL